MALEGVWRPAIKRLSAAVAEQTGVRDYRYPASGAPRRKSANGRWLTPAKSAG